MTSISDSDVEIFDVQSNSDASHSESEESEESVVYVPGEEDTTYELTPCSNSDENFVEQNWNAKCVLWDWGEIGTDALSDCRDNGGHIMKAFQSKAGRRHVVGFNKEITEVDVAAGELVGLAFVQPLKRSEKRMKVWRQKKGKSGAQTEWTNPVWHDDISSDNHQIWEITYMCAMKGSGGDLVNNLVFKLVYNFGCQAIVLAAIRDAKTFWNKSGWTLGLIQKGGGHNLVTTSAYKYWQEYRLHPMTLIIDRNYVQECVEARRDNDIISDELFHNLNDLAALYSTLRYYRSPSSHADSVIADAHHFAWLMEQYEELIMHNPRGEDNPQPEAVDVVSLRTVDFEHSFALIRAERDHVRLRMSKLSIKNQFRMFRSESQIDPAFVNKVRDGTARQKDVTECTNINAQILLENGQHLGRTVLHIAVEQGNAYITNMLKARSADMQLHDHNGDTVLDLIQRGRGTQKGEGVKKRRKISRSED
jgi:hypothetical protein